MIDKNTYIFTVDLADTQFKFSIQFLPLISDNWMNKIFKIRAVKGGGGDLSTLLFRTQIFNDSVSKCTFRNKILSTFRKLRLW